MYYIAFGLICFGEEETFNLSIAQLVKVQLFLHFLFHEIRSRIQTLYYRFWGEKLKFPLFHVVHTEI